MEYNNNYTEHISVLLNELVDSITIFQNKQNIIVDCTLWLWWHAEKIIKKMNSGDIFIWFDADLQNLSLSKDRLKDINNNIKLIFINSNFVNIKEELLKLDISYITWVYYDLWLSSMHLDEANRWFSFMLDWPLDMRLDKTQTLTAAKIINWYTASELRNIFLTYWEEPMANKIANNIVKLRKKEKFNTTLDLSNIIIAWPKVKSRIFQAIRIEVNKELFNIEQSLNDAISLLIKNWKIFVISFHSLEDRIVKHLFKRESKDCICTDLICSCKHTKTVKILTKKPITPTKEEIKINKRSRSAKARLAEKLI